MPTLGPFHYLEAPPGGGRTRGTLVLLHAFPLNARMWEAQLALAAHGWRVLAPQLRGFGGGAAGPPAASVDDYAGDVLDLLDGLHVRDAVVGGLSMGGYVAFALLRLASGYVSGLILADTRSQADTPDALEGRKRMLRSLADDGLAAMVDEMLPKLLSASTWKEQPALGERVRALASSNAPEAIVGALRAMMTRPDSTPLLRSIRCPTLILVGEEDSITPPSQADEMHQAIAGSELITIHSAGHLSNLEQPAAFNSALAWFLTHRV